MLPRVVIFVILIKISSGNVERTDLVVTETDPSTKEGMFEEKDDSNFEVFEATNEWQTIKEGQAIPRGLHVQMNLQTGEKQAKLMEENNMKVDKMQQKVDEPRKEKFVKMNENLLSKEKLKSLLKDFKDKFKDEDLNNNVNLEHEKNKYRNMEEIKQEFEGTDIWMKKDIEIIQELVEKINNSHSSKSEIIGALENLEYYVHQIDNARDLAVLQGYDILVRLLNQSDDGIKSKAAYVIGAAAQSNLPVQMTLLESGVISVLIRELSNQLLSIPTRKHIIYALSSILRIFPKGTQHFLKIGGLSTLSRLYQEDTGNGILKIRALTLLIDLLTEQMDNIRKKAREMGLKDYEKATFKAPLFKVLHQNGWCGLVTKFPTTTDNETKEKALLAINILLPVCKTTFKKNDLKSSLHSWRHQWQKELTMDNEDDTGYLGSLIELLDKILNKL